MTAQSFKTIVTLHGEKLEHNLTMSTDQRNQRFDLIANPPPVGFRIFNTTTNCHEFYNGFGWFNYCWKGINNPSSGGSAAVSAYNCNTASAGTMIAGTPVSGVTQTITATVTTVGTYNITTANNGITFSAAGTFTAIGAQNIVLTTTGTPTMAGTHNFTLSTTPGCNFSRETLAPHISSGGTAVITDIINCNAASAGIMKEGVTLTENSGVTQTITVSVATGGTYNISATANGVTFNRTGPISDGLHDITLTATGTPTLSGNHGFTLDITPDCTFNRDTFNDTSGGTAVIGTIVDCNTDSLGTMSEGVPVGDNVIQIITVNVTKAGSYNITTAPDVNGVTFSGADSIETGNQTIPLFANPTDIPTAAGTHTFTLNTTPGCSFDRETVTPPSTSGGTAIISLANCNTASSGLLREGVAVGANVTQTITVHVTSAGSYDIRAIANGVTFSGSAPSIAVGNNQTIVLTANPTDVPTAPLGITIFTLNTTPSCTFERVIAGDLGDGTVVTDTGRIWMDKNLGADRAATSPFDPRSFGSLYQWGRFSDGHQLVNRPDSGSHTPGSSTTNQASNIPNPGNRFITTSSANNYNWYTNSNHNSLWQGVNGINNPCDPGFRVPTSDEWNAESAKLTDPTNAMTWYNSPLKLVAAGQRATEGNLENVSVWGHYWSSTPSTCFGSHCAGEISFRHSATGNGEGNLRGVGKSVRCIKD